MLANFSKPYINFSVTWSSKTRLTNHFLPPFNQSQTSHMRRGVWNTTSCIILLFLAPVSHLFSTAKLHDGGAASTTSSTPTLPSALSPSAPLKFVSQDNCGLSFFTESNLGFSVTWPLSCIWTYWQVILFWKWSSLGFCDCMLSWFSSYLSGCFFPVFFADS